MATVRNLGLFPFCILDPENDINSSFVQMEMSQNLGLAFWWRVKNWRVDSANFTVINTETAEESEIPMPTGTMVLDLPQEGISSEKQLVCQFRRQFSTGLGPFDTNIFLRIFPTANRSGELIKMHIDVRAALQATQWFFGNGAEPSLFTVGNCTINILGQQLIFPIGGDTFSGIGSVEITASEYWPYDPNDGGGPIYDSSTGAQLRPFP